ncbi:hypothetical protein [Variovorax sp. HJSM1_2]|uniref:hypothetical protein n=1 Tax=Variovorax sp. HJSM1_2 TaxID=3366263 RepID=UPI003BDE819B
MHKLFSTSSATLLTCLPLMAVAQAHPSGDDMNAANNPLTPTIGANLQDQYVGRSYGLGDADSNALLFRGTLPHKLFGMPQILRATMPMVTTADTPLAGGRYTGAGDLNLFDVFHFKAGGVEVGVGPQLTIPSASRDQTGTGKWHGAAKMGAAGWLDHLAKIICRR